MTPVYWWSVPDPFFRATPHARILSEKFFSFYKDFVSFSVDAAAAIETHIYPWSLWCIRVMKRMRGTLKQRKAHRRKVVRRSVRRPIATSKDYPSPSGPNTHKRSCPWFGDVRTESYFVAGRRSSRRDVDNLRNPLLGPWEWDQSDQRKHCVSRLCLVPWTEKIFHVTERDIPDFIMLFHPCKQVVPWWNISWSERQSLEIGCIEYRLIPDLSTIN